MYRVYTYCGPERYYWSGKVWSQYHWQAKPLRLGDAVETAIREEAEYEPIKRSKNDNS